MDSSRPVLASVLLLGWLPAVILAGDLSQYRGFRFGTNLAAVAKRTELNPSEAKAVQRRPVLIQELEWRPRSIGAVAATESVKAVIFAFYDGDLFRIAIEYDRFETEGLTVNDMVEGISSVYGPASRPAPSSRFVTGSNGDQEEVLAEWQDPGYRFDLIRSAYGRGFTLTGVLKRLEAPVQAAILEAKRLDAEEAPQREAARLASEEESARASAEKARLVNKPKFRP